MIKREHFSEMMQERFDEIHNGYTDTCHYKSLDVDKKSRLDDLKKFEEFLPREQVEPFRRALNKYIDAAGEVDGELLQYMQHEAFKDGFDFRMTIE